MLRFIAIAMICLSVNLCIIGCSLGQEVTEVLKVTEINPDNWYEFKPTRDDFAPTAIDCSDLIEKPAGKHGFVKIAGENFAFQDGTTARFWGAQIGLWSKEDADYGIKALRKQGINIVRLHGMTFLNKRGAKTSFEYNEENFDRLDYLIYRCGQEGIYFILDVDYTFPLRPGDKVPGLTSGKSRFLMFFNDKVAAIKRRRMKDIFTRMNSYTKKRYCDDPTLAMVEVCNEDSIFWYQVSNLPEPFKSQLAGKYQEWLKKKYGDIKSLRKAWTIDGVDALDVGEGLDKNQTLAILPMWRYSESIMAEVPHLEIRAQDQLRFFTDLEDAYWQGSYNHLRKIGIKVPICGTNWKGGGFSTRAHMLTQSKLDYIDRHGYWDHPQGKGNDRWRIGRCTFFNLPMVKAITASNDPQEENNVGNLVLSKAWEQVLGKPMAVSEWNTCVTNEYSLEGPGLMAAYGMLQGWDAPLEFGHHSPYWRKTLGPNSFDMLSNPPQLLQYAAVSRMWLRQDVKEAQIVAEKLYTTKGIFEFEDDQRPLPIMAACIGKVGYRFVDKPRKPVVKDISDHWDSKTRTARSMTGELTWNASKGLVTIDTARTAAMIGFLSKANTSPAVMELKSTTRFGAVYVSSVDGLKPVTSANRLLITAIGPARNTGMEYQLTDEMDKRQNARMWRLKNAGKAPILIEAIIGTLTITTENAAKLKAWALDANGKRVMPVPLTAADGKVIIALQRKYATMYYELAIK